MTNGPVVTPRASSIGDVYEFVIKGRMTGENIQVNNVFHLLAVTPNCTANAIIQDWRTNMETEWKAIQDSNMTTDLYQCFNLIPFQTDSAIVSVNFQGSAGSTSLPSVVAGIITWRTGLMGRRYRGRTYMGAITRADVSGGRITNTTAGSKYGLFATKIMNRWGAAGSSPDIRFGVWSRVNGGQKPPHSPAGFTIISSFTIQSAVGTMGTRRVGHGL